MKKIVRRLGIALLSAGCIGATAATQLVDSYGLDVCDKGDRRISVPVWEPAVDATGNVSSDPPQQDGQIVYIAIDNAANDSGRNNAQMFSFTRPENMDDPVQGGLAVNISGNAQANDGSCRLQGYYRNQEVAGMHQGWVETYFGAVEQAAVSPDKYCLMERVRK